MFQPCGLWAIWQPTQRTSLLDEKIWREWKEKYRSVIGDAGITIDHDRQDCLEEGVSVDVKRNEQNVDKLHNMQVSKRKGLILAVCMKTVSNIIIVLLCHPLGETKKFSIPSKARFAKSQLTEVFQTVTNLPTPPQICLITKILFLKRVPIPLHRKALPYLWCFLWNNGNRKKGW